MLLLTLNYDWYTYLCGITMLTELCSSNWFEKREREREKHYLNTGNAHVGTAVLSVHVTGISIHLPFLRSHHYSNCKSMVMVSIFALIFVCKMVPDATAVSRLPPTDRTDCCYTPCILTPQIMRKHTRIRKHNG